MVEIVQVGEWNIYILTDEDSHLNIHVENINKHDIFETETGQGDGIGEQLAFRITTKEIESASQTR